MSLTYELARTAPSALVSAQSQGGRKAEYDPLALWKSYGENAKVSDAERQVLGEKMEAIRSTRQTTQENEEDKVTEWLRNHCADLDHQSKLIQAVKDHRSNLILASSILDNILEASDLDSTLHLFDKLLIFNEPPTKRPATSEAPRDMTFRAKAKLQSWASMPMDELQERMNKGEQLPIDEWMPNSGTRRPLIPKEAREHLEFGNKVKSEGAEAYRKYTESHDLSLLETALLRFNQGVRLMEWVEADKEVEGHAQLQWDMDQLELAFLRNVGLAAYHLGQYQASISACSRALEMNKEDHKCRYRRGMCYVKLSEVLLAKDDFVLLMKAPDSSMANTAGRAGIRELRRIVTNWKSDARTLITSTIEEGVFSDDRKPSRSPDSDRNASGFVQRQLSEAPSLSQKVTDQRRVVAQLEEALPDESKRLSRETVLLVLIELLEFYSAEEMTSELNRIRLECDFDAKRFIYRTRNEILPKVATSVLRPLIMEYEDESPEKLNALLRQAVIYHCALEKLDSLKRREDQEKVSKEEEVHIGDSNGEISSIWDAVSHVFWGEIRSLEDEG